MKIRNVIVFAFLLVFLAGNGCKNMSKAGKGAVIGAGGGAVVGGVVGKVAGNTAAGAIIGAAVGGAAGAAIGRYMDKQAEELRRDLKNAKVERVGEGIKITFESGILFNVNSDQLRSEAKTNITELAQVLNKYKDTNVLIEGHTDNTGTHDYNQTLSIKRAQSVANYAKAQGVDGSRISTQGYGEEQPVAENDTEAGKQKNRRVEIAIWANEKLKRAAKRGDI